MEIKDKQGTILYRDGEPLEGAKYHTKTMVGMPLPMDRNVLMTFFDEVKGNYDINTVVGEYWIRKPLEELFAIDAPNIEDRLPLVRLASPMEYVLFKLKHETKLPLAEELRPEGKEYVVSRVGRVYAGLNVRKAIHHLLLGYLDRAEFLMDNFQKPIQEGYVSEDVQLTLNSGVNVIHADVAPASPEMREGKKSKLEEIILKYKVESEVKVESE
jgi:hypothetical protein